MSLRDIYPRLSHKQNIVVVEEVSRIILALQPVAAPFPGLIQLRSSDGARFDYSVRPIDLEPTLATEWRKRPLEEFTWEPKADDAYDFFAVQFGRRLAQELLRDPRRIACEDYQTRFMEAARQMSDMGVFKDQGNCLCHLGLYARNIVVLPDDKNYTVQVTGVRGWDIAVVAPKFVSCATPWWLWQCDPDENGSTWEEFEESYVCEEPRTPQGAELYDIFEKAVGNDFLELTYRPQFRLARQLFRLAVSGLQCKEEYNAADKFLDDWKEYQADQKSQTKSLGSCVQKGTGEPLVALRRTSAAAWRRLSHSAVEEQVGPRGRRLSIISRQRNHSFRN